MDTLEKKSYYNILYGFYQNLLTEKQKLIFEDYYYEDFSLSEIAENHEISRNAVFDTLKKVEKALDKKGFTRYNICCCFSATQSSKAQEVDLPWYSTWALSCVERSIVWTSATSLRPSRSTM